MLDRARSTRPALGPAPAAGPATVPGAGPRVGPATARPGPLAGSNRARVQALREGGASPPPELLALCGQELVGNEQTVEWCGLGREEGSEGWAEEGRRVAAARSDTRRDSRRSLVPHPESEADPVAATAPPSTTQPAPPSRPSHAPSSTPTSPPASSPTPAPPGASPPASSPTAASSPSTPSSSSPTPAPSSSPSPPSPAVPLPPSPTTADPVVDHYMNANWDRRAYDEACATFNVRPDGVGTTMEQLLPPQLSSAQLEAANVAYALVGASLNAAVQTAAGAIPVLGPVFGILYQYRGGIEAATRAPEPLLGWGAVYGIFESVRASLGMFSRGAGLLADHLTVATGAAAGATAAGGAATAGLAGTGVGAPAAVVTGGATAGAAATGAGTLTAGEVLRGLAFATGAGGALLDSVATGVAVWRAGELERAGDFDTAARVRTWARDHALRALAGWIDTAVAAFALAGGNSLPAGTTGAALGQVPLALQAALKPASASGSAALGIAGSAATALGTATGPRGPLSAAQLDDVMLGASPPYAAAAPPGAAGPAAGLVAASREASTEALLRGWGELRGDRPAWSPGLLAQLREPTSLTFVQRLFQLTSPAGLLDVALRGTAALHAAPVNLFMGEGADTAVALARRTVPLVREGLGAIEEQLSDTLPSLDEFVSSRQAALEAWAQAKARVPAGLSQLDAMAANTLSVQATIADVQGRTLEALALIDAEVDAANPLLAGAMGALAAAARAGVTEAAATLEEGTAELVGRSLDAVASSRATLEGVLAEGSAAEGALAAAIEEAGALRERAGRGLASWRAATLDLDIEPFLGWVEAMRLAARALPREVRIAEFMDHVARTGPAAIDAWRARHGAQVLDAFFPSVPPGELDAAREAWERRRADLGALPALDDAWAAVRAAATGQGPDAVEAFRAAVDRMLTVTAPSTGADTAPGPRPFPEEAPTPPGAQARG